jgi:hypothetical protein
MENAISRRRALGLVAGTLVSPLVAAPVQAAQAPVLVELFTSQGCSSCPAADRFAGVLAQRKDVILASLNVDYWDYLGWKDTLAKPDYSQRQYAYAKLRGDGQVYTPQMVVNGKFHAVGSNTSDVETAIERAQGLASRVPMALSMRGKEIVVDVGAAGEKIDGTIWLLSIAPSVEVAIERGENTGKKVTYHNVVTKLTAAGMWKGGATQLSMPKSVVMTKSCKLCVAVLHAGEHGDVLGLSQLVTAV